MNPIKLFFWTTVALMGVVENFGGLTAARFMLGFAEGS